MKSQTEGKGIKKYKVSFEQILTGYVEVFADNKYQAIDRLIKQPPVNGQLTIETEDIEYKGVKKL